MGIIIDVLILLLLVNFVVRNYKRPQLRCGIETICFVVAAILCVPFSVLMADVAYEFLFRDVLAENISAVVGTGSSLESTVSRYRIIMDKLPSVVQNAADSYQVNSDANIAEVERLVHSGASDAALQIVDLLAGPVIKGVFRGTFCAILFTGLQYLMTALGAMVENALYSPDRATQNTVLCGVFGCFKGIIVITVIATTLQLILPALPSLPLLNAEALGNSFIFKLFYHQNVLMLFMGEGIYPMGF